MDFGSAYGCESAYHRPAVVVQNDTLNGSQLNTVVVCAITTNMRLGKIAANVVLDVGEAGLPRPSVVNVSQVSALDRDRLRERCGRLSEERLAQVLVGVQWVIERLDCPER